MNTQIVNFQLFTISLKQKNTAAFEGELSLRY